MKTKLLAFILALCFIETYAQYTMIPDSNFEQALINLGIDSNMTPDGQVLTAEVSGVTTLDITNLAIGNLAGIEDFSALTSLTARFNNLTTVDLSSNTNLEFLDLFENSLTAIDVQANTMLTHLDLGSFDKIGKRNQLATINVSLNTAIEFLNVSYNDLTTLNVNSNTALTGLGCSGNLLNTLDVSNNTALTGLTCSRNSITSLNLSGLNNLTSIVCDNNTGMTTLTLPASAPLQRLYCYSTNNTGMLSGTLNVGSYTNLETLWIYGNNFSGTLDVSNNNLLENIDCSDNNLTSLLLPNTTTLFRLVCDNNEITSLDASQNSGLTTFWCYDNLISNLLVPTTSGLTTLWCWNNNLTSLNVSTLTGLVNLDCGHNPMLTSLTLPSSPPLVNLWVYDVGFPNTNFLAGNTGLQLLDIGLNGFDDADVDVSAFTNLTELYCNGNNLTTLNLAGNTNLLYLGIYDNFLTELNLENNLLLEWVSLGGNTTLPSSGVTMPSSANLTTFWAFGNGFTDLSFLKAINRANMQYFDVGNGNLTSIDVSDMIELIEFYCNGNASLSSLDINNNNNDILDWMWAHDTALTCIKVDSKVDADNRDTYLWQKPGAATYEEFCATAGVDDVVLNSILLYPNPFNNKLYLDLKIDATYSLSNMLGQEIQKGALVLGSNELDMESLSSGLYLLNLETPDGKATKKIIKN